MLGINADDRWKGRIVNELAAKSLHLTVYKRLRHPAGLLSSRNLKITAFASVYR
jgi:hypothetical protein